MMKRRVTSSARKQPRRQSIAARVAYFGLVGELDELGSGGTFEALPMPLGSFTELLFPPALPGPAGTPLTPVVPAPAEPALGVPVGLPEAAPAVDPLADPPAPCARAVTGSIRLTAATIAIRFDFFDIGFLHVDDRVNGRRAHFVPVGSSAANGTHPASRRMGGAQRYPSRGLAS
jgi:hypothetical protein